jgi:general secretion pathway protein K
VEVIAALPGVGRPQLRAFLETRLRFPTDAARVRATLGPAQQHLAEAPQRVASVELRATLDDGFSAAAKAVIVLLRDDSEPYRILAWNISGPASTCLHAPHLANKPLSAQRNC